ncbi:prokaryotic E2 ligase family D protein [Kaistella sp. BT6-1-3]|uniref:Prokaryotic E2 ligase family D protein n=2 Tax=Kaistella yananensis TaxID=2989820 RepID=A0ABT3JL18_9FLAO|nr:prokaryotic E2 ligase family D protein [Kaistella yananensis]MCW4451176.1 prokaryotic E2 ligase family D protein [Kaistella yananensis]
MEDITQNFGTLYYPTSALVFYQSKEQIEDNYVEHFDMDKNGNPINAHPLTEREAKVLAKSLAVNTKKEKRREFLNPKGILATNILHINPSENASVIWFTKSGKRNLFFSGNLEIPNGIGEVPALLWFATERNLTVFALANNRRPTENTLLFYAPFFNVYENGNVCMGTVDVDIKKSASLEEFTQKWEDYFFNSYFSHLMNGHNPINGNCLNLWKELIGTGNKFPNKVLKKSNKTLKNLLK